MSDIRIKHGACEPVLLGCIREGLSVDLAYLDPPFFTNEIYRMKDGRIAFEDRWEDLGSYLDAIGRCLELVYTLLAPHGSFVVHLDPRTVHHVKVRCDALFGIDRFAGEIIWRYRRWPARSRNLQSMHDVLLRYVKDPTAAPRFTQLYEPLAESTQKTWGTGRQSAVFEKGRRKRSSTTEQASPGAPLSDVWSDVGIIAPVSRERTGYPTQKPLKLLERIVRVFSNEGDVVLDPMMGSGTTLEAAARLGRAAIGIDRSTVAVDIAAARLTESLRQWSAS